MRECTFFARKHEIGSKLSHRMMTQVCSPLGVTFWRVSAHDMYLSVPPPNHR
jgi:hypothetical protein